MTLKTSFFNKAIYKSTIKRFIWGSVLYFALLLISAIVSISTFGYYDYENRDVSILTDGYLYFPLILTIIVSSITAILIFRFLHSKSQIVFIHSSPVSRRSIYISSLLAGLTLMVLPPFLITLIYFADFGFIHCLIWFGINVFSIFILFSISTFSCVITGNSFAAIVITIIIHLIAAIFLSAFELIAQGFLYGFSTSADLWDFIAENNFVVAIMSLANDFSRENFTALEYVKFVGLSLVIYVISYYVYKYRKSETASDVAGFKFLNHIFKYLVTFIFTFIVFAIFETFISENTVVFFVILFIFSLISYFGAEMILKKTVNVFSSYKGYIGYVVVFSLIMIIFSCTSFFGYETRIPHKNDVEEICVYEYYYNEIEPYTNDPRAIEDGISVHNELIKNIQPIYPDIYYTRIHIKYRLKNGKTLSRTYPVTDEQCKRIMDKMYENLAYKMTSRIEFTDDANILNININNNEVKDKTGFMNALREDVTNMSYSKLSESHNTSTYYAELLIQFDSYKDGPRYRYLDIPLSYTNTIKWIEENIVLDIEE